MARIRTIKPEFWQDELVASWPPFSRLAYIGMWNEADDEGRLRASVLYLKSRLFPYDEVDVFAIIMPIIKSARIIIYEVDGQTYGLLPNFNKHQVINHPSRSRIPPIPECYGNTTVTLLPGREGKGREQDAYPGREHLPMEEPVPGGKADEADELTDHPFGRD